MSMHWSQSTAASQAYHDDEGTLTLGNDGVLSLFNDTKAKTEGWLFKVRADEEIESAATQPCARRATFAKLLICCHQGRHDGI